MFFNAKHRFVCTSAHAMKSTLFCLIISLLVVCACSLSVPWRRDAAGNVLLWLFVSLCQFIFLCPNWQLSHPGTESGASITSRKLQSKNSTCYFNGTHNKNYHKISNYLFFYKVKHRIGENFLMISTERPSMVKQSQNGGALGSNRQAILRKVASMLTMAR